MKLISRFFFFLFFPEKERVMHMPEEIEKFSL